MEFHGGLAHRIPWRYFTWKVEQWIGLILVPVATFLFKATLTHHLKWKSIIFLLQLFVHWQQKTTIFYTFRDIKYIRRWHFIRVIYKVHFIFIIVRAQKGVISKHFIMNRLYRIGCRCCVHGVCVFLVPLSFSVDPQRTVACSTWLVASKLQRKWGKYSQSHYSMRLKTKILLHKVISKELL